MLLSRLFLLASSTMIPHGHCYLWQTNLVALHVASDALTAIAYYSIPLSLIFLVRRRDDLPFNWIFVLFGGFILACGTAHVMDIWTLWHPDYWVSGVIKAAMALVSVLAAALLVPTIQQVLKLPNLMSIEAANQELRQEIEARKLAEDKLAKSRADMKKITERISVSVTQKDVKILIIDDFEGDRLSYIRALKGDETYNYQFIHAEDGEEGLALAQAHQPDIIFLDYRLPDSEGLELLEQLKQQQPGVFPAVLMMTGQGDEEIAVSAIKAGAVEYLVKHRVSKAKLTSVVHRVLGQQRMALELDRSDRRRQLIADSALRIHQSLDLQQTLETAVTDVQQVLGCETVAIYQKNEQASVCEPRAHAGGETLTRLPYRQCCAVDQLHSPQVIPSDDGNVQVWIPIRMTTDDTDDRHQLSADWGTLIAHYSAAVAPMAEDIDLLSEIAVQLGITIQQTTLLQQLQDELAERRRAEQSLANAQRELEQINQNLELRIQQRTQLLKDTNQQLRCEVEQRRQAEASLREQENQLRLFVKHAPAAIAMLDTDLRYIVYSHRWLSDYSLGDQNLKGHCHYDIFPKTPDRWKEDHQNCLAGAVLSHDEDSFVREDGQTEWLRWELHPWRTDEGKVGGLIMLTEFITQQKENEQQLETLNKELQRSNKELEHFAYIASHDLQEPLRKIRSYSDLLVRRYRGQLDERADKYVGYITDGTGRMTNLINDLLEYSRMGRGKLQSKPLDLELLLHQVTSDLQAKIEDTQAEIHVPPSLPTIQGNEVQIRQLLQNLIGNSLKYRSEKAPVIVLDVVPAGEFWQLSISDNGIGISPEFAERIFVVFQRLHLREAYEGTGIGLAVCKRIVEHHGGRIWLEPQVEEGATFHFTLPMAQVPKAAAVSQQVGDHK
ncbi:MAG: ATP-binding protein [Elainellaceae cyanobacterium]